MNDVQFYSFSDGVSRMLSDIENTIQPIIIHLYPILQLTDSAILYITIAVFCALLYYLVCKRKHKLKNKFENFKNFYFAGLLLVLYMFLTEAPLRLGPSISLNFGLIILPIMAKKLGPLVAGIFAVIQYASSFLMHSGEAFSFISLLIASISGMIYGRFLYMQKLTYTRCLCSKLAVNMLCNVILTPSTTPISMSEEFVNTVTHNITLNIVLAPIQALLIYFAIYALKKIEIALSEE